jgi:non-lysosomal glucosylceramidase
MREVEFLHATNAEGAMRFRAKLPLALNDADTDFHAAADGQMGCIMKIYRDWKLCGEDPFLSKLWPKVKSALSFAWVEGGWDANQDGVMEGCQHNTMDVDYYGPNPQMQGWYLGALKAAAAMAQYLTETGTMDEAAFAQKCQQLFERGRDWTDQHLFNGEYYEHHIAVPDAIHPNTTSKTGLDESEPILQLGKGCLIDQLAGQCMAHVCGLGYILNPEHVKTTLRSILKYNLKHGFHDHFNHLRNYVFADEVAVLMATYPRGERLERPFPYYNEVMTGFEHTLAAHLIYEGMVDEGIELVGYIRERYDGKKRSPYNEAECGHHYARAMAAWAHILALTDFHYDGTTQTLTLSQQPEPMIFTFGSGWGTWHTITDKAGTTTAIIQCHEGSLPIKRVLINQRVVPFRLHA